MRSLAVLGFVAALAVAPRAADAGRGGALVRYLSDDTTMVIVVDVAHARKAALFKTALGALRDKFAWWDELAKSGIELDKAVDTIVVGGDGTLAADEHHGIAILEGRLDKLIAALQKDAKKQKTPGGADYWVTSDGTELAVVDKKLLTARGGLAAVLDRLHGKAKAKGAAAAKTILAATSDGTDVFGGVVADPSWRAQLQGFIDGSPKWVAASVAIASQLTVDIKLAFDDGATAEKVRAKLAGKLADPSTHGTLEQGIGKGFSDSLVVDRDGAIVRVSATLTPDEVEKIAALAKMF